MKKTIFVVLCSFMHIYSASGQFMKDGLGRPIAETKYTNMDGSPYLSDKWTLGEVTTDNLKVTKNLELKYELVDDRVVFKGDKGQEMDFMVLVLSFTLYADEGNKYFKRFTDITEFKGLPFFEVLNEGEKLILLKKIVRGVMQIKAFGSATTTTSFSDNTRYYLLKKDKTYEKIKKEKKVIMAALADKSAEVEAFVRENKTDFKKDADLSKLLTYYNSL